MLCLSRFAYCLNDTTATTLARLLPRRSSSYTNDGFHDLEFVWKLVCYLAGPAREDGSDGPAVIDPTVVASGMVESATFEPRTRMMQLPTSTALIRDRG